MPEFIAAVRKGGRVSRQTLSDSGIRWLFRKIDRDNSGKHARVRIVFFVGYSKSCMAFKITQAQSISAS